jgi:acyl-CoA reductase-like NAD-dependent aldehyde dehydrogenase
VNQIPLNGRTPHDSHSFGPDGSPASVPTPVHSTEIRPRSPDAARPAEAPAPATVEQVRIAVARARRAQYAWHLEPLSRRVAALTRAAQEMLRRRSEAIDLARTEMGKVVVEGLFNEALGPLDTVKAWTRIVEGATARRRVGLNPISFPRKRAYIDLVARGVVGVIAPWNFPIAGLYRSTLPALLTGNGVVVKPSEFTPRTSAWFVERLAASLPEGLVQVVQGDGRVGEALIDAGIDACVFTGSPETGRTVQVHCAQRGISSSIEMGGKDAAIVLADCDLERTVAGITQWALSNAGQACAAVEIAYVDDRVADALVEGLRRAWTQLRVGSDRFADVGPMANREQFEIVASHVQDARAKGATVVCGGAPIGEGLLYAPTVLDRCTDRMKVVEDETFGPVLAVVRIAGAAEAIRRVNASRYGLGASIWTRDIARAERLAERLDVGVVTVNNHALSGAIPALPWSGTRDTGLGIANSAHSLATFVRPKATIVDRAKAPDFYWMPYDEALFTLGDIIAGLQVGQLGGVWRLPLLMHKRVRTLRRFFQR